MTKKKEIDYVLIIKNFLSFFEKLNILNKLKQNFECCPLATLCFSFSRSFKIEVLKRTSKQPNVFAKPKGQA